MNIDPETGKNYGLPPSANDLRNFAADLDDRDEATQQELDMLRLSANEMERLRKERDEARRMHCRHAARYSEYDTPEDIADFHKWDCFNEETEE